MRAIQSGAYPIVPGFTASLSTQRPFGSSPFRAYDPGRAVFGSGNIPVFGMKGLKGGCGCGPYNGCGCSGLSGLDDGINLSGLRGLRQNVSLDQLIAAAGNYATGVAQASLPASAAVPPQYGSAGALATSLMNWAPYLIGGYLLYKVIK
jgi:hypothetical protein